MEYQNPMLPSRAKATLGTKMEIPRTHKKKDMVIISLAPKSDLSCSVSDLLDYISSDPDTTKGSVVHRKQRRATV